MAKQLKLPFMKDDESDIKIYEIYQLDSVTYPQERRYHSHVRFINAGSNEDALDSMKLYVGSGGAQYYDVRKVDETDVLRQMTTLELQLETCREVLYDTIA